MWGIGILLAVFAPLQLLVIAALLTALIGRVRRPRATGEPGAPAKAPMPWGVRYILVLALVVAVAGAVWGIDRQRFRNTCDAMHAAQVDAKLDGREAEGIYLNDSTANSFGMRYLRDEGFKWMEAADYRKPGRYVRYELGPNHTITMVSIEKLSAKYEVRSDFSQPEPGTNFTITRILERESQKELANAAMGTFMGGRMRWFLGVYGMASCEAPGTRQWSHAYHLAREVFGK